MRVTLARFTKAVAAGAAKASSASRRRLKISTLGENFPVTSPLPPLDGDSEKKRDSQGGLMLKYIVRVMEEHPDCVVLTQVGSFYEMYFEHAIEYGPKLNLRVARKRQASPVAHLPFVNMAGFPAHHVERYVKTLVETHGKSVVLLEQVPHEVEKSGTEEAKRPVARIVTPGTLIAESFVNPSFNNYLVVVNFAPQIEDDVVLAWVDVAVGQIFWQQSTRRSLANDLARLAPAEVLVESSWKADAQKITGELLQTDAPVVFYKFPPRDTLAHFLNRFSRKQPDTVKFAMDSLSERARKACAALLSYVDESHPGAEIQYELPQEWHSDTTMQLDARSRDALEMLATKHTGSARGSLLSVLRRTVTPSGSRMLQQWLTAPLQNVEAIERRQNLIGHFVDQPAPTIVHHLSELPDGRRLLQKLFLRKLDPLDLVGFANSVETLQNILAELRERDSPLTTSWTQTLGLNLDAAAKSAKKISRAINISQILATEATEEEPVLLPRKLNAYNPVLRPNTSRHLTALYKSHDAFESRQTAIMHRLEQQYPGRSVKLSWSPLHRYHVKIRIEASEPLDPSITIVRHKHLAYLSDEEWSQVGSEHDQFFEDVQREEERILRRLRREVVDNHIEPMRSAYNVGDELDVCLGLAQLAREKHLVRPRITADAVLDIRDGRHITVEDGLELGGTTMFAANDCVLGTDQPVCMVTGPNMGGKSTYIRQGALISLLAHMGSFVPASQATVGLIDRIFCRIGAGDDLYRGRSTFMMEMLETAEILEYATERSLAILDEVGRGTSGKDGLAIAAAVIKHLALRKQCRTLFATHFGREIWDVLATHGEGCSSSIKCVQAAVEIVDGDVTFDYELRPGISSSSHGLLVAKMASFPSQALADARTVLDSIA